MPDLAHRAPRAHGLFGRLRVNLHFLIIFDEPCEGSTLLAARIENLVVIYELKRGKDLEPSK